jgi:SlyX protein
MSDGHARESTRLDALETRVAHQDRMIADLNDVISAQWKKIDALERHLTRLREEFETSGAPHGGHEPPPHY